MRWWRTAIVAAGLLVVGCSDDESADPAPEPDGTSSTTAVVDRSGIALLPVGGEPTTTIQTTGTARIVGSVGGPAGAVGGATVRVERLVAGQEIRTDVLTGPDGTFAVEGVPGGRYRVRAFQPPRLAQTEPEVRFLVDGQEHVFELEVEEQAGLVVRASIAPDPPLLDRPVNLVVVVAEREVGTDGVLRTRPLPGIQVELDGVGRWSLRRDEPDGPAFTVPNRRLDGTARTDADGRVRYELRCEVLGAPGLSLRIPVVVLPAPPPSPTDSPVTTVTTPGPIERIEAVPLELSPCVNPEVPPTTASDESSSTTVEE